MASFAGRGNRVEQSWRPAGARCMSGRVSS